MAAVLKTNHVNPFLLPSEQTADVVDAVGFNGRKVIAVDGQRPAAKENGTTSDALDRLKNLILEIDPEDPHDVLGHQSAHSQQLTSVVHEKRGVPGILLVAGDEASYPPAVFQHRDCSLSVHGVYAALVGYDRGERVEDWFGRQETTRRRASEIWYLWNMISVEAV